MNIYAYMNYYLIAKGYSNMKEIPIEEIINGLRKYLLLKIDNQEENFDLYQLFAKYTKIEDKKNGEMIIHFLLQYISVLQDFALTWKIKNNQHPTFVYNHLYKDKFDSLITSPDFNLNEVFALVLTTAIDLKETEERIVR